MKVSTSALLKRSAIVVHRWLGVSLCLVFLLWFTSGIGMMYWDFPSVTEANRLDRSPALDPSTVRLSPGEAYATLGEVQAPAEIRLNTFDGRPVYRFQTGQGEHIVYADTGEEQLFVSNEMVQRVASAWTGQSLKTATVEAVEDVDQWTVGGALRTLRPLWKYSWPNGEHVYISGDSGEVVQYTTTASRVGAYLGPIPHWLYFTPLRKHPPEWSRVVIWASGVGTFAAILGVTIGIWMYSPSKRYRNAEVPTSIPYRGQKRWHTVLGLIFGVATATWAFSGMLSMDPFPARTGGPAGSDNGDGGISEALRGDVQMADFSVKHPREVLVRLDVKELEFTTFAGEAAYLATLASGGTRIVPVIGEPGFEFDRQRIIDVVTKTAGPGGLLGIGVIEQYDMYYLDRRRQRPLPVILARVNDPQHTRYYIDPKTARVVSAYSSRNWVNRWVYHGLHSLDFPWLYNYRPAWDIVVIAFMIGGTALCVTSLILAWRVLGRKLRLLLPVTRRGAVLNEDLV